MFIVEMIEGHDWVVKSEHTLEVDANRQMELFIANGETRIMRVRLVDNSDGNISNIS